MRLIAWSVALLVPALILFADHDEPVDDAREPRAAAAHAPSLSAAPQASAAPPSSAAPQAGKHLPRARPTRLLIPDISVDAPFTGLAIGSSGQLEPPPANDVNLVGWQADGVSPGEAGTSIIAGHVDTATAPAVFAKLNQLEKRDRFSIKRSDRRTAVFVVDSVETFSKSNFPDRRVYADTPQAQVRLITCAGDYDRAKKDYTENLVVFAHLV